jgi:glycosyltransferase involved in cell wall biosynthesis
MYRKTDVYDADPYADFVLKERPRGVVGQLRACAGLVGYMRRERPDAVISYQHYGNIFGTIAGLFAGTRRRIANQSGAPGTRGALGMTARVDKLMGRLGFYQYSVVNSGWTEAQFAGYPPAYRRRLRRIDHGVVAPSVDSGRQAARAAFGLPDNVYLVISSGRLTPDKNQAALVEALATVPDIHLAIAGVGPEEGSLRELARARGVADRLHLVGEVPPSRMGEFLAAGDLFAFASRNETFGLSVAEAAVAGLPIVANTLPVLQEVLTSDDGAAALFADAEHAEQVAAAISRIMAEPGLAAKLSAAGRRLGDRYSPAAMCAAYERLLAAD